MYVGNGQIVQSTWPKVELSSAPIENVIWATGQPLTPAQRGAASTYAQNLVGTHYDVLAYPFLVAAILDAAITKDVSHLFGNDKWWDCSGLIAECDIIANAPMFATDISAHFVTPSQLMTLGAQEGWFQGQ
jgi:hypothetical protein